ncbi:MAG: pilin [Patescibacteria group bacterium]
MSMLKRFKLLLLAPVFFLAMGLTPALVLADCAAPDSPAEAIQCGTNNAAGVPVDADPGNSIDTTIGNVVDLISVAVGIAAVIMLIVGGFRYITSAGNAEAIKAAKNTILYALIGLVIVALAQLIVNFVLNKTTQP